MSSYLWCCLYLLGTCWKALGATHCSFSKLFRYTVSLVPASLAVPVGQAYRGLVRMVGRADMDTPLNARRSTMQCSFEGAHSKLHHEGCTNGLSKTTTSGSATLSTEICAVVLTDESELEVWGRNLLSNGEPSATICATYDDSTVVMLSESCAFPAEGEEDKDLLLLCVEERMGASHVRLDAHRVGYTSSSWDLPPMACPKQLSLPSLKMPYAQDLGGEDAWFCAIKDREGFNGRLGLTSFMFEAGCKGHFGSLAQEISNSTGPGSPDYEATKLLLELLSKLQHHIQVQAHLPAADISLHVSAGSWQQEDTWKGRGAMYRARQGGCEMLILKNITVSRLSSILHGELNSIWGQIAKLNPNLRTRDTFSIVSDVLWAEECVLLNSLGANAGVMIDNSSVNKTLPLAPLTVGDAAGIPMPTLQAYNKHASGLKASFLCACTPHKIEAWESAGRTIVAYRLRQVQRTGKTWRIGNIVNPRDGQQSLCEV